MRLTDWLALRCRQRVCFEEAMYVQKHARVETKEDRQWLTRTNTTARQQGALKAPLLNIFVPYNPKGSITNAKYKAGHPLSLRECCYSRASCFRCSY